jgi:hypothetical protein
MTDSPSYEELRQDAASHWQMVGKVRDTRYQLLKAIASRPWICPTCGQRNTNTPICTKCRSARILEMD